MEAILNTVCELSGLPVSAEPETAENGESMPLMRRKLYRISLPEARAVNYMGWHFTKEEMQKAYDLMIKLNYRHQV